MNTHKVESPARKWVSTGLVFSSLPLFQWWMSDFKSASQCAGHSISSRQPRVCRQNPNSRNFAVGVALVSKIIGLINTLTATSTVFAVCTASGAWSPSATNTI
jgi:hypothetical protein